MNTLPKSSSKGGKLWCQMDSKEELVNGPQNAWTGYYSLAKQGIKIDDFETYIAENAPLKFTDPKVIIHSVEIS